MVQNQIVMDKTLGQRRHDRSHRPRQDDTDVRDPARASRKGLGKVQVVRGDRQRRHRSRQEQDRYGDRFARQVRNRQREATPTSTVLVTPTISRT